MHHLFTEPYGRLTRSAKQGGNFFLLHAYRTVGAGFSRPLFVPAPGAHTGAPLPVAPGSGRKMTRAGLEPAPTARHLSGWSAHPFPVLSFRGGRRPPWESVPHFCDGERTQRGRGLPRRFAPRNDRNGPGRSLRIWLPLWGRLFAPITTGRGAPACAPFAKGPQRRYFRHQR